MMKPINEKNLSYLTGAFMFLLFSTYFISIILYGRMGVTEPFIIAGIGALFCLVIIYLTKKYPVKKIAIAIGTGICLSLLVLMIAVFIGTSLILCHQDSLNPDRTLI